MSLWDWLFNPSGLTAHGFCLTWAPGLIALHVAADAATGLAYFSIPIALAFVAVRRPDLKYGWVAYLFVAFILACGATHVMSIFTLWVPAYGIEGLIKLVTAILSVATAAILWPLIPKVVGLPSAAQLEQRVTERTEQLTAANARLTEALAERATAQDTVQQAMKALMRSEAEFRASFEAAAVGKAQSDPRTSRILRVNRAMASMLGYEPEEMVGRSGWEFAWPEDLESDKAGYQKVLEAGADSYVREKRYAHKDGYPIWARVSATIVRTPDTGEPYLTVAVVEDIDQRRKAQEALMAAKHQLEETVAERTAAVVQRDLLLREVYHRVKNNLQIIDAMLVMQARESPDAQAKAALTSLRSRVFALGLVHHQLMGSADLRTFDVAPFLTELTTNILEGGAAKGVTLEVRAAPLQVGLDFAIPLGLVVTELVTNSLKHAFPDGKGHIEVLLDWGEAGWVTLVVADDGKGQTGGAASPRPAFGTRVIEGLVTQLGGRMTVKYDNGSRSEIRLPVPDAA